MKQKVISFFLSFTAFFFFALPVFASNSITATPDSSGNVSITSYSPSFSGSYVGWQLLDDSVGGNCASGSTFTNTGSSSYISISQFDAVCSSFINYSDNFILIIKSNNSNEWYSQDFNYPSPATPTPTPYIALSDPTTTSQISNLTTGLNNTGISGIGSVILIGGVLLITAALLWWVLKNFRGWLQF